MRIYLLLCFLNLLLADLCVVHSKQTTKLNFERYIQSYHFCEWVINENTRQDWQKVFFDLVRFCVIPQRDFFTSTSGSESKSFQPTKSLRSWAMPGCSGSANPSNMEASVLITNTKWLFLKRQVTFGQVESPWASVRLENIKCLIQLPSTKCGHFILNRFCLRPKAKDLGITRVVVLVVGFFCLIYALSTSNTVLPPIF